MKRTVIGVLTAGIQRSSERLNSVRRRMSDSSLEPTGWSVSISIPVLALLSSLPFALSLVLGDDPRCFFLLLSGATFNTD